MKTYGGVEV